MPKFLIEVPHQADQQACARAVEVFRSTGSHFLTHADWGCLDGVHSAWIMVEVESKAEALAIVPPVFRPVAEVVRLNQFSMAEIEPMLRQHEPAGGDRDTHGG